MCAGRAFGASTEAVDAKWERAMHPTRGRVDAQFAGAEGAAGLRTRAAATCPAVRADATECSATKLTDERLYGRSAVVVGVAGGARGGADPRDFALAAGSRSGAAAALPAAKGALHGAGVAFEGAGGCSVQYAAGRPGQRKWQVGEDMSGVRPVDVILATDDGSPAQWAGKGGTAARSSAGRPGQHKWLVGGDYVGVRPVADISDLVLESESQYPSAG